MTQLKPDLLIFALSPENKAAKRRPLKTTVISLTHRPLLGKDVLENGSERQEFVKGKYKHLVLDGRNRENGFLLSRE